MDAVALIFATLSLAIAVVGLGIQFGVLDVVKKKPDKFSKYRNDDGLLGGKKHE